jgi:ADP-ribosylglycohydrolase
LIKFKAYSAIWGFVVGDALGVPHEFRNRESFATFPVADMIAGGTHLQPIGTWSDDTSLLLCVLENIYNRGDSKSLAKLFLRWYQDGYQAAHGKLFDIGITTQLAFDRIIKGVPISKSGLCDKNSAGNGSLMRSLPYSFIEDFSEGAYKMVLDNKITHRLPICHESCLFYIRMARSLAEGQSKDEALDEAARYLRMGWRISDQSIDKVFTPFQRLFSKSFALTSIDRIYSNGYVIHTLEAAIWSFLNGDDYRSCVLKAVNLGGDTDTIAALTGGLAGIFYGISDIPSKWRRSIVSCDKIDMMLRKWLGIEVASQNDIR